VPKHIEKSASRAKIRKIVFDYHENDKSGAGEVCVEVKNASTVGELNGKRKTRLRSSIRLARRK
jgi:hypothetical protein